MQFSRYLTYKKSGQYFQVWPWVLKAILTAASFYYVASKLIEDQLVLNELSYLFKSIDFVYIFFLVTILMVANWLFESKKWQLLASNFIPISLQQALKAILAGVSLDAILPFGAGAIGSKVLSLKGVERQKLIAPIIVTQGVQSFWTTLFGLIGLSQLAKMTDVLSIYGGYSTTLILILLIAALGVIVFKYWPQTTKYYTNSIKWLSKAIWLKIAIISLFRYLIFLTQLLILSIYLAPEIPIITLIGVITWMFFAKTIIPKPGHLGALGIRGASVVFFLSLAGFSYSGVVLATLILWVINLAVPSLIGMVFIKDLNFRKNPA